MSNRITTSIGRNPLPSVETAFSSLFADKRDCWQIDVPSQCLHSRTSGLTMMFLLRVLLRDISARPFCHSSNHCRTRQPVLHPADRSDRSIRMCAHDTESVLKLRLTVEGEPRRYTSSKRICGRSRPPAIGRDVFNDWRIVYDFTIQSWNFMCPGRSELYPNPLGDSVKWRIIIGPRMTIRSHSICRVAKAHAFSG
jgi:hypothetical protein